MKHLMLSLVVAILAMLPFSSYAQASETERISALESTVKSQQTEINSLQGKISTLEDRYAHYEKALNLQQVLTITKNNVKYGILSAEGNKEKKTVKITMMILNSNPNAKRIQFYAINIIDYNGNTYETDPSKYFNIGPDKWAATFRPGINTKATIEFTEIPSDTRIADLYIRVDDGDLDFRDINIDWK